MVKAAVNRSDEEAHYHATVMGGLKWGSVGLGAGALASVAAARGNVRAYKQLTLPLKAFLLTSAGTASFIIGADAASRKYELAKYALGSGTELERLSRADLEAEKLAGIHQIQKSKEDLLLERTSTKDILVEWGKRHRYGVVFGAWAASMVGSFGYISMTPLSFSQKLVQARMVAQGLTVVVLVASAGLSQIPNAAGKNDDDLKRDERESSMYAWKKGSPAYNAQHAHSKAAVPAPLPSSAEQTKTE